MEERRAGGLRRVPVEALVEICGRDAGGAPPFEAESVDVSGRGMHVRTAYLPEIGAPLVCRLDHEGREIVVEGVVAWQSPAERGGEFGIQFTALDSGSVDALRALCELELISEEPEEQESEPADAPGPGSKVRLHIDGLGAPMKASIQAGNVRRVQVASNLEFLKVGRSLELEELGTSQRRPARIFGVDVMIDPKTQIPQLVVALRFQDVEEHTPEPSVIDSEPSSTARSPKMRAAVTATLRPPSRPMEAPDELAAGGDEDEDQAFDAEPAEVPAQFSDEAEIVEDAAQFKTRAGAVAVAAGQGVKRASAAMVSAGGSAAVGLGRLFGGARAKFTEYRQARTEAAQPRRTTAPPPSGVLSADGRRLRPQSMPPRSETAAAQPAPMAASPSERKRKMRKLAGAGAVALLMATVSVLALKKPTPPPGAESDAPAVSKTVAADLGDVTEVDEQGDPVVKGAAGKGAPSKGVPGDEAEPTTDGLTAEVPLFGPTPMATLEPAPLGDAPELGAPVAEESEEEKEMAAAKEAPDETFEDKPARQDKAAQKVNPADVKPWGKGNVSTPTIHRLRLDRPGGAIKGAVNPTGFTVVVPEVKVMESPKGIENRDSRIARVRTRNGSYGAEVTFQFKESVPGYRVRLRKDFVEFLISAPGTKGAAPTSAKPKAKTATKKTKKSSG